VLSGVLLLVAAGLSGMEPVFLLGFVTAVIATAVVIGIRRLYAESLLTALRSGLAEQVLEGSPGLPTGLDRPDVRTALTAALGDPSADTRRLAVTMLGRGGDLRPDEQERVAALVDDPSPWVRAEVAAALAGDAADTRPGVMIASLLESESDDDRVAGLQSAVRVPDRIPPEALGRFLTDRSPAVRAAAIAALSRRADGAPSIPTTMLIEALGDDSHAVRSSAASALAGRPGVGPDLIEVLTTGGDHAQDAALLAVGSHATGVHTDLLAWANGQIQRAETLHRAHGSLGGLPGRAAEMCEFLATVIAQRARRAEDRAIAALVAVGAPTAGGLMRRSLRSTDQDARAQAIEALDSLGDRRLGRALSACLEAASEAAGGDPLTTLDRLTQDDDRWIARLSRTVRDTATHGEDGQGTMSGAERAPTELDTMLLLRRVPLFARLDPEDLQRLAMVAVERDYPDGTALMREGDPGDELVVIVEGSVRVVQTTPDGEERFIRRYQGGEHIGELAVLLDRPRVASVIAEGDVSGLVLAGDGLRAILRERPEAAMAMLATLAERISSQ
jgi:HEAT repeat protein